MLNQKCTISLYLGNTANGVSYGDAIQYRCRFEDVTKRTQQRDSQESLTSARVFLPHTATVNKFAKLEFNGVEYKVKRISVQYALTSISHYELEVV
jgi:hypothetical protein